MNLPICWLMNLPSNLLVYDLPWLMSLLTRWLMNVPIGGLMNLPIYWG
jgi:hypothetical protein